MDRKSDGAWKKLVLAVNDLYSPGFDLDVLTYVRLAAHHGPRLGRLGLKTPLRTVLMYPTYYVVAKLAS